MATEKIGRAVLELATDSSKFFTDLDRAEQRLGGFRTSALNTSRELARQDKALDSLRGRLTGVGQSASGAASGLGGIRGMLSGLVPAASIAGVGLLVKGFTDASGALVDLSASTGLSLTELQRLKFGAEQTGSSLDVVTKAVQFAQKSMTEGNQSFVGALSAIGLKLEDVRQMEPGAMFEELTSRINAVQDPAQRTALRMQLLGKSGQALTGDFKALGDQAAATGQIMSDQTVAAGDNLGDAFDQLIGSGKGLIAAVLTPIAPLLTGVAQGLTWVASQIGAVASKIGEWTSAGWSNILRDWGTALELLGLKAEAALPSLDKVTEAVKKRNQAVNDARALPPITDGLEHQDEIEKQLAADLDKRRKATEAATEAQKKANAAADEYVKSLDALDAAALRGGVLTESGLNKALAEMVETLNVAARQGPQALETALRELGDEAANLAARAKASGLDVSLVTGTFQQFATTIGLTEQAMVGWEQSIPLRPIGDLTAGLQSLTIETEIQATEQQRLTDAYEAFGLKTPQALQAAADAAVRNYQVLRDSGTATTTQLKDAYAQMIEAQRAATGKLPSAWDEMLPRITGVVENIGSAVQGTFSQMLLGAKGFKDGFLDIWDSLKAGVAQILTSILQDFTNRFLKGLLAALTGAQGGFLGAFGGLFGGGGGGLGSLIPGLGALLGGGGGAAFGGVGAAVPISTLFPAGGFGAAGAGGAAAGAGGGLFGLGTLGTAGVIGGAALAGYGLYRWLTRGQRQNMAANDSRDAFTSQFGGTGTGAGSGFANLAAKLTEATGEAGGGRLFQDFIDARKPEDVAKAIEHINAALDAYAKKTAAAKEQEQQQADAIAATKAELEKKTEAIKAQLSSLDDELAKLNASEAPEEHMGTVERQTRERIAREKDDLQRQLDAAQEAAAAAIEAINQAGSDSISELKTQGEGVIDGLTDGFVDLGDLTKEQIDRIKAMLAELGKHGVDIPINYRPPEPPDGTLPWRPEPMASGGYGRVTRPTLFLAGEAGPEDVAFSGANRRFGAAPASASSSVVFNEGAIRVELPRGSSAEQARDFLRALRREVQRGGQALDDTRAIVAVAGA